MLDRLPPPPGGELLGRSEIGRGADGRHQLPERLRGLVDLLGGMVERPALDEAAYLGDGGPPPLHRLEARVVPELGSADEQQHLGGAGLPVHPAVAAADEGGALPPPDLAFLLPGGGEPDLGREHRLERRDLDALSATAAARLPEREEATEREVHPGVELALMAMHHQRLPRRIAAEVEVSAHRVVDDLRAQPVRVRPGPAEGRVRHVDERRGVRRQGVVVEPARAHRGRPLRLDQDLRVADERPQELLAVWRVEVRHDALLAGVESQVEPAALGVCLRIGKGTEPPQALAARRLDLDDPRAQIAEDPRGDAGGDALPAVDHRHIIE